MQKATIVITIEAQLENQISAAGAQDVIVGVLDEQYPVGAVNTMEFDGGVIKFSRPSLPPIKVAITPHS
jgi:hypothetical protein